MSTLTGKSVKIFVVGLVFGTMWGSWLGNRIESYRVYKDCRITGVVRMGESAFKCDQFSRVKLEDNK